MQKTEVSTKIVNPFDPQHPCSTLYKAGPNEFIKITLCMTSAGPCAIGTNTNLLPIGGTNGQLLPLNRERIILLSPGTILYASSIGVQRIDFTAEPIPYLQSILFGVEKIANGVIAFAQRFLPIPKKTREITPRAED